MSEDKRDNICPICKHFPGMMCSHDVQDWIERIADLETQLADRDRTIDILQTRLVDAGELHLADEQTVRNLEAQLAAKDAELANAKKELADWKTFTYCVYCGHEEHTDDLGEAITAHIMTCEQHPIHKAASQIADRDRTIADLQAQVGRLKGLLKTLEWGGPFKYASPKGEFCPMCGMPISEGHEPDCELAAELNT